MAALSIYHFEHKMSSAGSHSLSKYIIKAFPLSIQLYEKDGWRGLRHILVLSSPASHQALVVCVCVCCCRMRLYVRFLSILVRPPRTSAFSQDPMHLFLCCPQSLLLTFQHPLPQKASRIPSQSLQEAPLFPRRP